MTGNTHPQETATTESKNDEPNPDGERTSSLRIAQSYPDCQVAA
jgi:hypothetical protein